MTVPLASVVIPAHDERSVIARCLRALTDGSRPGELDVIVVANACRDDTAAVARAEGARVVETPVAGKAHALGLGDQECRTFPRLYLDADIELTADAVRSMVDALDTNGALACAPLPNFDLTGAGWPSRRFHVVLDRLLGARTGLAGTGAYMLTEAAHERAFPIPDVIADDSWVHRTFTPDERVVVAAARVSVRLPRTVPALIRRRARVRLGNRQLERLGRRAIEAPLRPGALVGLVRRGRVGPLDAACFLSILLAERLVSRWRDLRGTGDTWSADRTTRS
ncbi:MAG TPA: glycosyltransferase [Pseudonocardiaceae bacterium]|nr:glycosyltransferase [Pseudonocardiaceae bacterium]